MAGPLPPSGDNPATILTDLDTDSIAHAARYLTVHDISNMAMSSKFLKTIAYSDSVWKSFYRTRWSWPIPDVFSQESSIRNSYLSRHTSSMQLKFKDPLITKFDCHLNPNDHLLLHGDDIVLSQGSKIKMLVGCYNGGCDSILLCDDHRARITCMRLFSLNDTHEPQDNVQNGSTVLVTSSCDHTIRLYSKGSCNKCFRGHSCEVTTLSDKLLGDGNAKLFASGGADGTVRLWSINMKGKQGQHAHRSTLHGHQKPVTHMAVAGHNSSLLISMSKDSKMRVWDTATSSSLRSSCCVGMSSYQGAPVGMKCHESLVYVAAGSSIYTTDLRTMREVSRVTHQTGLHSFDTLPSKHLLCTGGTRSATLWDTRRNSEPITVLDGHAGPVKNLHMDAYKVVTGGPDDDNVKVWEAQTGALSNSLACNPEYPLGCSAVAMKGGLIAIACSDFLRYMDFRHAAQLVSSPSNLPSSKTKFWGPHSDSDTDEDEDEDEDEDDDDDDDDV